MKPEDEDDDEEEDVVDASDDDVLLAVSIATDLIFLRFRAKCTSNFTTIGSYIEDVPSASASLRDFFSFHCLRPISFILCLPSCSESDQNKDQHPIPTVNIISCFFF